MLGGGSTITATIRVSVTPTGADVGSTLTLANAAAGSGSDGVATITGTGGTAQTAGPVADAPHATTTGVSCPAGPVAYGSSVTCTVTVTDTSGGGATVPTGAVAMTGTLGTSTACTLAAATASSASCSVTFSATGVGSASVGAAYAGDATHVASSGSSATIATTKKTLTVTTDPSTKVYGAANPGFTVGYAGFVPGDTVAVLGGTLGFATAATATSPVGTYAVTPNGLTSANYAFSFGAGNLSVTTAPLTIIADPATRSYGAANPPLAASYSGFVNGDDPTDLATPAVVATGATPASPAGTYPITVAGATSSNYAIAFVPGTLTVGTATLTVTATSASRPYGQANPGFTAGIAGFQSTDTAADLGGTLACSSAATASSPVGTYPITCSGLASGNYAFAYVAGTLTVTPVALTVTPGPHSRDYGAANPTLTATITGFVNGDTVAVVSGAPGCSTPATPTTASGTAPIACALGSLAAANYAFDLSATANLTIDQAPLTITVDPSTKVYGTANPAFGVTSVGLQNGETLADLAGTLALATAAGPASGVGSYPVTPSGLSSPNYAITFVAGTLSITKATLTVTPLDAAIAPGDPIPATFAVDLTGFVAGDDASVVSGAASCSTDATLGDPSGTYTITCTVGSLSAANYDVVVSGTAVFTIGIVTLHVTVDDAVKTYGDPNPPFTVSWSGFVNGDTPADLGGSLLFATAATTGSPAGAYPVSVSGLTSATYVFDDVDGTLTIAPAAQAISFGPLAPATYGDAPFDVSATSDFGLPVTFSASGSCAVVGLTVAIDGAGSCTITAHQAGDANHDAAPDAARILTIAKATPMLTWATPADIVFATALDGTQLNAGASVPGTYLYSPAAGAVLGAGVHTLHVTFTPTDGANNDPVDGTVDLAVLQAAQAITFGPLPDATDGDAPFDVSATSDSGLPVTFTASGACSVAGVTVTITGAGTCTVTAHQAGDTNHAAAPDIARSFTVAPAAPPVPVAQAIAFGPLAGVLEGHAPVTLTGTASSGLPVSYTVTGPCSVAGLVLTILGVGTCAVTAHQDGDASHLAAAPVTSAFDVLADPGAGAAGATPSSIDTDKDVASPGGHVVVTATGFKPGSEVTIRLEPDGQEVTVTADVDGNVEADLVVPAGADAGPHAIEAVGIDPNGEVLDLTTTITVVTLPETSAIDGPRATGGDDATTVGLIGLALVLVAVSLATPRRRRSRRRAGA